MAAHTAPLLALATLVLFAGRVPAQGAAASLQAGVTRFQDEQEFEMGARVSHRGVLGVDFSIDVYPEYLLADALAGVADLTVSAHVPLGVATVELRACPSVLGVVATGGAIARPGYNAGLGVVFTIDPRIAVRADYTYRRLQVGDESYPTTSFTAGFLIRR